MFDKILENLDDVAGKLGLPADQLRTIAESLGGKLDGGGMDQLSALMEAAREHGLPVEKLREMLGGLGEEGLDGLIGKAGDLLGGEGGLGGLEDMAKGLFGKD